MGRGRGWIGLALALLAWQSGAAHSAQHHPEPYPERVITLISPFAANSDTTRFGQSFSVFAAKYMDQAKFNVESRPGASGSNAALAVRLAAPDGYILLIGRVATQVIAPALDPKLPYRWQDFTFLGLLEINPLICAVRADSPWQNTRDLLQAIRKAPGSLKYSATGSGTILNMVPQYMFKLSGLKADAAQALHFDGGQSATDALLAGKVDFVCNNAGTLIDLIKSGQVRPLFTTAPGRLEVLPQVQNAREAGLRDIGKLIGWTVLAGPRNMPPAVVARWKTTLAQVAQDPEWRAATVARGGIPALGTSNDTEIFVKEQAEFYDQLVSSLKLRP